MSLPKQVTHIEITFQSIDMFVCSESGFAVVHTYGTRDVLLKYRVIHYISGKLKQTECNCIVL